MKGRKPPAVAAGPDAVALTIDAQSFRKLLASALLWVDSSLPHLNTVHLDVSDGTLSVVSTNGFGMFVGRLHKRKCADFKLTLPADDARAIRSMAPAMRGLDMRSYELTVTPGQRCSITINRFSLASSHISGFVDWRRVMASNVGAGDGKVCLAPKLLSLIGKTLPEIGLSVTVGKPLQPVRFDGMLAESDATVLLMPMRMP